MTAVLFRQRRGSSHEVGLPSVVDPSVLPARARPRGGEVPSMRAGRGTPGDRRPAREAARGGGGIRDSPPRASLQLPKRPRAGGPPGGSRAGTAPSGSSFFFPFPRVAPPPLDQGPAR